MVDAELISHSAWEAASLAGCHPEPVIEHFAKSGGE
jgi:hypothetical protein